MKQKSRLRSTLTKSDPGFLLINLIIDKISLLKLTTTEACNRMDIPHTYFSKLRKKEARADRMPTEYYNGIALFLDNSPVVIRMLAGQIQAQDFYRHTSDISQEIDRCINFIATDPDWMAFFPPSTIDCNKQVKLFIIELYEKAKDVSIMKSKINYLEVMKYLEEASAS